MLTDKDVWEEYLKELCFVYRKLPKVVAVGSRPKVSSFANSLGDGTYILVIANQLTAVISNYYYEIWDCGNKSVYGYWEKI